MTNMRYGSEGGLSKEHNFSVFFLRNPSLNQIQLTMTTHIWYHKALKCTALHRLYLKYLPTDLFFSILVTQDHELHWFLTSRANRKSQQWCWCLGQPSGIRDVWDIEAASIHRFSTPHPPNSPYQDGLTLIRQSGRWYHIWHITDFLRIPFFCTGCIK